VTTATSGRHRPLSSGRTLFAQFAHFGPRIDERLMKLLFEEVPIAECSHRVALGCLRALTRLRVV
jgi:hypothetical protein